MLNEPKCHPSSRFNLSPVNPLAHPRSGRVRGSRRARSCGREQHDDRAGRLHRRFSRRYTGGVREFEIEAKNLRGVIREMDKLYPGLGHHLEEETTVAIDGQIHETSYFQPIRPGCEIFFIPKLEGG